MPCPDLVVSRGDLVDGEGAVVIDDSVVGALGDEHKTMHEIMGVTLQFYRSATS